MRTFMDKREAQPRYVINAALQISSVGVHSEATGGVRAIRQGYGGRRSKNTALPHRGATSSTQALGTIKDTVVAVLPRPVYSAHCRWYRAHRVCAVHLRPFGGSPRALHSAVLKRQRYAGDGRVYSETRGCPRSSGTVPVARHPSWRLLCRQPESRRASTLM
jgi:hypothetical protein